MRKLLAVITGCLCVVKAVCQTNPVETKSLVSIEVTGLITTGQIRLDLSHKISDSWSVSGRAAINTIDLMWPASGEEKEHDNEFMEETIETRYRTPAHHEMLIMQYWPEGTFYRTYLSVGGKFRSDCTADLTIGIGRYMRICRRTGLLLSFEADIVDSFKKSTLIGEGISACICITF